jgi:hypothetical protein
MDFEEEYEDMVVFLDEEDDDDFIPPQCDLCSDGVNCEDHCPIKNRND